MIQLENIRPYFLFLPLKLPRSFWWALSLAYGIFLAHYGLLLSVPLLCILIVSFNKNPKNTSLLICFVCVGYGLYEYHSRRALSSPVLNNVTIEGTVTDKAFIDHSYWKHRLRLNVSKVKINQTWHNSPFVLYLYSRKRIYAWVQDTIQCESLTIKEPSRTDFALYLQREGVSATSFSAHMAPKIITRPKFSFFNWLFWQRELLQIKLRKKLSPKTFSLFSSLFIGNRKPVTRRLNTYKQHFKKWGILHHLARSGLHLVIFIMVWHYILNILPFSFLTKHSVISFLVFLYFFFSWSSLSFLRALTVYILYKLGTLTRSKPHPLHVICLAALLLLLHNPFHILFLDFQLSFLLSFCLLWIAHIHHQRSIFLYKSLAEKKVKPLS